MPIEKISLSNIIVLAPICHLVVTAIYLWGWFAGFGSHSAILADARDLFSLSISAVIPIYVSGGLVPALTAYLPYRHRENEVAPTPSVELLKKMKFVIAGFALIVVFALWAIWDLYHRGEAASSILVIIAPIIAIAFVAAITPYLRLTFHSFRLASLVAGLVAGALGNGMASGQSARLVSYADAKSQYPHCGAYLLLRRFGDTYVAVGGNNQKVVTDLECKVVMLMPPPRAKMERRFYWHPFPHVRYERW